MTLTDLAQAIELLDEPFRTVVKLHDLEHRSNAEIAAQLGIPYNTVATRLHRAHKRLEKLLRAKLEGPEEG